MILKRIKYLILLMSVVCQFTFVYAQDNTQNNKPLFNRNYKYIDKDLKLSISKETFDSIRISNKFYPSRIKTYKDSLRVVLQGEINDWNKASAEFYRMTFSYARVGYYLWISETEAISLCKKYNFQHPFHFYNYFRNHEELWDDYMLDFMKNLRNKLVNETGNKELLEMTNKKFLKQALILNPDRITALRRSVSKREGKSCGKENCCQNKKK